MDWDSNRAYAVIDPRHTGQTGVGTMNDPLARGRPSGRVFNKYDDWIRECRSTYYRSAEITFSIERDGSAPNYCAFRILLEKP